MTSKTVKPWKGICSKNCWNAKKDRCTCKCHGANHGKGVKKEEKEEEKESE